MTTHRGDPRRQRLIDTLARWRENGDGEVYRAVLDLYRDPRRGDDRYVLPLLAHHDPMVVASALHACAKVYGRWSTVEDVVYLIADGDPRDEGELPLQGMAIRLIGACGTDPRASRSLLSIAENERQPDGVFVDAWMALADRHGIEFDAQLSSMMSRARHDSACISKRQEIARAARKASG